MNYLDTSVVLSLYLVDDYSELVTQELSQNLNGLYISPWVSVEVKSALSLLIRKKVITKQTANKSLYKFQQDKNNGKFLIQTITKEHFNKAEENLSFNNSLRAADSLHLAIAQIEYFQLVTTDKLLGKIAIQLNQQVKLIEL